MSPTNFNNLGLSNCILQTLETIGYTTPSPIQAECITYLLEGGDIIGQAQTGTGKTAAFSLPLLDNLDAKSNKTQLLVLTPTRELAIQVSEAIKKYATNLQGISVLAIYGGQSYDVQLRPLKKGVQVVVATPGRVMDHIKRKTLQLKNIKALVLDEADEMLRMGFIDDVKWILSHIPETRQIALFSATMPKEIKAIATKFLRNPKIIKIQGKTETANNITQKFIQVANKNKIFALKRILEATTTDGVLIFTRTKNDTIVISEQLTSFGYKSSPLNGDIPQKERERIISNMKNNRLNIIVATDVAARGIDVVRITHVINYDIPREVESYIHRIGRTGRAGRSGDAILFASSKDMRMLKLIEKVTKQKITEINLPGTKEVNAQRVNSFNANITKHLIQNSAEITEFKRMITEFSEKNSVNMLDIAASLAIISQNGKAFLLTEKDEISHTNDSGIISITADKLKKHPQIPMLRFRIEVGRRDRVSAKNIKTIIANEADIDSDYIGTINILDNFSTIDLPDEMPVDVLEVLKSVIIVGRKLGTSQFTGSNSKKTKKRWGYKDKKSRNQRQPSHKNNPHNKQKVKKYTKK